MNNRLNNYLAVPTLGAVLFLSSQSYAFAQSPIEVMSLGIGPVYEVTCENLTIPQIAPAVSLEPNVFDCEASGIVFSPGEDLLITITGDVIDPLFIGGRLTGMNPDITVNCENISTNQSVAAANVLSDWNCIDAGLEFAPGDKIVQSITGTVAISNNGGGPGQIPPTFDHSTVLDEACSSCHTKPAIHLNSGNNCEVCHTTDSWILGPVPPVSPCGVIDPNLPDEPCIPVDPNLPIPATGNGTV